MQDTNASNLTNCRKFTSIVLFQGTKKMDRVFAFRKVWYILEVITIPLTWLHLKLYLGKNVNLSIWFSSFTSVFTSRHDMVIGLERKNFRIAHEQDFLWIPKCSSSVFISLHAQMWIGRTWKEMNRAYTVSMGTMRSRERRRDCYSVYHHV